MVGWTGLLLHQFVWYCLGCPLNFAALGHVSTLVVSRLRVNVAITRGGVLPLSSYSCQLSDPPPALPSILRVQYELGQKWVVTAAPLVGASRGKIPT